MSLITPTTADLSTSIVSQLEASLEQTVPLFPKAFIRILAKVLAAAIVLVYRYAGFSHQQMFIAHATMDPTTVNGTTIRPLIELGRQNGTGDPLPATRAELVARVTVLSQTGSLPASTQLVRADSKVVYLLTAARALDAATVDVTIRASSSPDGGDGSGTIGNLIAGDVVEFASPTNVATQAVVQSVAVVGADAETPDAYRSRVLRRSQARPQGGAYADYRAWAESVPGVAAAYPYTGAPGYVNVYTEAATTDTNPDGIPDAALLTAVEESIDLDSDGLATRRSANARRSVLAVSRTAFGVEVAGLATSTPAGLAAVQAAISEGVDEYLRSREPFILGLSVLPRLDRVTQGEVGGVVSEIASASGASVRSITLLRSGVSITAYTLGNGELAKLDGGEATFVG